MENFRPIKIENWQELNGLFKRDWPKYITTYNMLENLYRWKLQQEEEGDSSVDRIELFSVDEFWREHGTFVLMFASRFIYCDTLEESGTHLKKTIRLINWSNKIYVRALRDELVWIFREFTDELKIDLPLGPAYEYYQPKEEIQIENLPCPEEYEVRKLTAENIQEVDEHWTYHSDVSLILQRNFIKYNPSIGLFKKFDGELIGWCLVEFPWALHCLHIKKQYRGKGFSHFILNEMKRICLENDKNLLLYVVYENNLMTSIIKKHGATIIDTKHWFTIQYPSTS